jgi:hypothetical protein
MTTACRASTLAMAESLCDLGGASHDNVPRGIYNLIVELPDLFPLFP